MKRTSILVMLALVATFAGVANAGWHHHHRYATVYQAAPAYYMPAYAPIQMTQGAPQSGIADILIAKLLEKAIGGIDRIGTPPTPTTQTENLSSVQKDLQELKAGLSNLDARVENVNSTLQRQGEFMIKMQDDLRKLKADVDETSTLRTTLEEVKTKLKGKSLEEVKAVLKSNELQSTLKDIIGDDAKVKSALDEVNKKYDELLK